jgi:hypothetical protein
MQCILFVLLRVVQILNPMIHVDLLIPLSGNTNNANTTVLRRGHNWYSRD